MHMHVLYAYTPNGCQFQQEIECQLLVGPIFWAIDDVGSNVYRKKPLSPFQLAQTKLLWLVPVIVFFFTNYLGKKPQTVCFEEPKKNGNRRKRR